VSQATPAKIELMAGGGMVTSLRIVKVGDPYQVTAIGRRKNAEKHFGAQSPCFWSKRVNCSAYTLVLGGETKPGYVSGTVWGSSTNAWRPNMGVKPLGEELNGNGSTPSVNRT